MNTYIQQYTCESGTIGAIIIPNDATENDLKGIAEMLDIIIKRHFKIEPQEESENCN